MKNKRQELEPFSKYRGSLDEKSRALLEDFFSEIDARCVLSRCEKRRLEDDFKRALLYYSGAGLSIGEALARLDPRKLGAFYMRPPLLWFALDDAAKIYPLSMQRGSMAVFRLSVYLKEAVVPELLQIALDFTIKRFPSFATTLKKGIFWHYLDSAKRRFDIEKEDDLPCRAIKVSRSGSQAFRVLCHDRRISVEFFHVLTDGTGGLCFLKALAAEYLRLRGAEIEADETLFDIAATPCVEETENAFASVPVSASAAGFGGKIAAQMSGRLSKLMPCKIVHFKMNASELKKAAGKCGTTVSGYLLALMFLSTRAASDEMSGDMCIQVPVNMRQYYHSETVRNFSLYCGVRIAVSDIRDKSFLAEEADRQLREKASKELMTDMVTATERLVRSLRYVPLVLKRPVAQKIYGFLGDNVFSNTLSNLGVISMPPAMAEHVESMDALLGMASVNRAECTVITVNDTATFSITKNTADPSFEEALYELLCAEGINVEVEGSELYEY